MADKISTIEFDPNQDYYDARSRIVDLKLSMYFSGRDTAPLEIEKSNYLIDFEGLEELYAESDSPFGEVSANEISFSLANIDGIFSPTDSTKPYYGKIRKGVPIHVEMRAYVEEDLPTNWDDLGWYYVTEWEATVTGLIANVTACDRMYDIFKLPQVKFPVVKGLTFYEFYQQAFKLLGETGIIDSRLTEKLLYAYNTQTNGKFLTELGIGAQAGIYIGRDNVLHALYTRAPQPVADTLTDADQIISIEARQSASLEYDGASVGINTPQESLETAVLSTKDSLLPVGRSQLGITNWSKTPLVKVIKVSFTEAAGIRIEKLDATSLDVNIQFNAAQAEYTDITIDGTVLDNITSTTSDVGENLLSISNLYVQTSEYAEKFKRFLSAFASSQIAKLEVTIRGSAKYQLGTKLRIVSDKYRVDFTGVLIRQSFKYAGNLGSTITLLNSAIMEVV